MLGPDLLDAAFDREEALRRLQARPTAQIGDALLDQRALAGIGNVFKCEALFLAGVHPFTSVSALPNATLERIVDAAREQLRANVLPRSSTLSVAFGRRTTRSLDPKENLWVYGRGGRACRRCGAAIESRAAGPDSRLTYWCPVCQAAT